MALPKGTARQSRLATDPINDRYQRRVGSSLSPASVSSVLRMADLGELQLQADLLDEVREKDGHLQSVLSKRESAVAGAPWELRPSQKGPRKRAETIARFCTEALQNLDCFPMVLADLMSAMYHGRAIGEVIWVRDGRSWLPKTVEPVHARRCRYSQRDWQLRICDQEPGPFSGEGIPVAQINALIPGKLIVHTPRIRGGYPTREGLGRTTVWYAGAFKGLGIRDLLAYAEQYGRPIRMGVYGTGKDPKLPMASAEDVDEMLDALENLSSKLVAAFPDTCRPELYKPPSEGNSVHAVLLSICDEEVSKAVLGNTLTTQVGSTGGNRALGEVHADAETKIAKLDALQLAATLRRDLLIPLVELNGWSASEAPAIMFTVEESESLDALASRFKTLGEAGVAIEEAHIRDRMAIPEPRPGEPVIGRKAETPPPQQ